MERENSRPVLGRPAIFPAGPCPLSPKPGDGGASSFGLRLRTGERCSRRGRSRKGTEKLTGPSAPVHLRRTQNHPHGTPRGAPALTAMAALSRARHRSPGTHPSPSPALKHRQRCLPHPPGPGAGPHAQILPAGLPRGASASAGHLEEAEISEHVSILCPHPPFPSRLPCRVPR